MKFKQLILLQLFGIAAMTAAAQSYTDTLTVYFRQGKAIVDLSYMGNDSVAAKIRDNGELPLSSVLIQGSASPEGSTAVNEQLSRQRATAIAKFFNIPDSIVVASFTGSYWEGLQSRVKSDPNVPFKAEVEAVITDIVNSKNKACAIDVLRNMHRGRAYEYLYSRHFPYLRRAEIVLSNVGTHTSASLQH